MEEDDYEKRALASMSAVQLITAILEAGPQLEALGLQIRLTNGVAQILTSKIQNERLAAFIAERAPGGGGRRSWAEVGSSQGLLGAHGEGLPWAPKGAWRHVL